MSTDVDTRPCPHCRKVIPVRARRCKYCDEYVEPALKPKPDAVERMLLPVGRTATAIVAGYMGLFACFPLIGIPAGILGVVCGIMALKAIKADPSLSGAGRAWFGIVVGGVMAVLQSVVCVSLVLAKANGAFR